MRKNNEEIMAQNMELEEDRLVRKYIRKFTNGMTYTESKTLINECTKYGVSHDRVKEKLEYVKYCNQ